MVVNNRDRYFEKPLIKGAFPLTNLIIKGYL
jgi:hypothetical protein